VGQASAFCRLRILIFGALMEQVGRYQVKGPIGRGAMGVVYLAEDPLLNRQVAIKTVDLAVEDEQEREFLRDRLLKDARAAAALTHPGIVSVTMCCRKATEPTWSWNTFRARVWLRS
jgi:hypothetical protein